MLTSNRFFFVKMTSTELNSVSNLAAVQRNLRIVNNGITELKNLTTNRPYYDYTISESPTDYLYITVQIYQIIDKVITQSRYNLDIRYKSRKLFLDTTNARTVKNGNQTILTIYPIKAITDEDISALYNIYVVYTNNNYYFIEMDNFNDSLDIFYHVLGIIPCSNYIKYDFIDGNFKYYKGCIGYYTDNKPIFESEKENLNPEETVAFILENNPNIQFCI